MTTLLIIIISILMIIYYNKIPNLNEVQIYNITILILFVVAIILLSILNEIKKTNKKIDNFLNSLLNIELVDLEKINKDDEKGEDIYEPRDKD